MPRGKNRSSASETVSDTGNGAATVDVTTVIANLQNMQSQQEAARLELIGQLEAARERMVEKFESLAQEIANTDEVLEQNGVTSFYEVDISSIGYLTGGAGVSTPVRGRPRKNGASQAPVSGRGRRRKGSTGRPRGVSSKYTLPNSILIAMSRSEAGTEFGISAIHEAVQKRPTSYSFSGQEESQNTIVSQALSRLINNGHVARPSRATYVLTPAGVAAAEAVLNPVAE